MTLVWTEWVGGVERALIYDGIWDGSIVVHEALVQDYEVIQ